MGTWVPPGLPSFSAQLHGFLQPMLGAEAWDNHFLGFLWIWRSKACITEGVLRTQQTHLLALTCHKLLSPQGCFHLLCFWFFPQLQLCRDLHWDGSEKGLQSFSHVMKALVTACFLLCLLFGEALPSCVDTRHFTWNTGLPFAVPPSSWDLRGNWMLQYKHVGYMLMLLSNSLLCLF